MAQSVKVNYILNLINTGSQMVFPLITFPYACRIIEANGIGQINFFTSIIQYISLFTCLGIPMYAIREIARVRNDAVKMNRIATEILLLHTFLTILGYIVVGILCITIPQVKADVSLFLVLSLTIFFTAIGCEWFYQGIEDFKYITIRGLIVKVISVVLLFVFVRTKEDLIYYGWYTVLGVLGGNIFNFIRLRKYIKRENILFSQLNVFRHLKPALQVFSLNVVISIYIHLNPVLLGFMKGALAVGFFTAATKLMLMIMKLSSCLGSVMMPRVSHLLAENKEEEFNRLIQKSYDFTIAITLPLTIGLVACAPTIIRVLCGDTFLLSTVTSQIIAPVILMVGISNVMGIQVLYPKGKINTVTLCCGIGALTDILLNIIFIPKFSYNGTAIAYIGAEVATTVSMYLIAKQYIPIKFITILHIKYLAGSLIMGILIYSIYMFMDLNDSMMLCCQVILGIVCYSLFLLATKDPLALSIVNKIKK